MNHFPQRTWLSGLLHIATFVLCVQSSLALDIGYQLTQAQQSALEAQPTAPAEPATLPPPAGPPRQLAPANGATPNRIPSARDISLSSAAARGEMPQDLSANLFTPAGATAGENRPWSGSEYNWTPSLVCHNPLYFQQVAAERYGQMVCCPCFQPLVCAGRFYCDFALLPAQMACACPCSCQYAYGYYRPGSPTPCTSQCVR